MPKERFVPKNSLNLHLLVESAPILFTAKTKIACLEHGLSL
jgi:hypothetical protein